MSDLLNSASLVMIPSGYAENKVYSVVPSDGSGDLSFTRASNGTRINSAGLVEVVAWNLVQNSENFSAIWTAQNSTITTNSIVAPNGTTTADSLIGANGSGAMGVFVAETTSVVKTMSCYVKKGSKRWAAFVGYNGNSNCWYDLDNGVVGTRGANYSASSITSVGNGWYRIDAVMTVAIGGTSNIGIYAANNDNDLTCTGDGTTVLSYIWGFQLNIGSTAKPYFPTTDRLNVPRLTYQNGGGGCPSLLLEKQSTNLVFYSEQFDNAGWTKINGNGGSAPIITANYATSPDGTQNADRIQLTRTTATSSYSVIYQAIGITVPQYYTISVWLKAISGTPTINLGNIGQVTLTNEWVRYTLSANFTVSPAYAQLAINTDDAGVSISADFLAWGFQLEASSYATSYIPTTSASATRVADACFKTGISSLIGQTEGVIFVDFVVNGQVNNANILNFEKNTTQSFFMALRTNGDIDALIYVSNSLVGRITAAAGIAVGQRAKVAYAYKSGSFALYANGVQLGFLSSTFTPVTTFDDIFFNDVTFFNYQENVSYNQAALFPTRLTNAELASLTTL